MSLTANPLLTTHIWICLMLGFCLHCCLLVNAEEDHKYDVLVLGAGMAGVSSARTLAENGVTNFAVLEATDRVGGRAMESQLGDYTVELGAMWIHGGKLNPMYDLAVRYNLSATEAKYDSWLVFDDYGNDVTAEADLDYEKYDSVYEHVESFWKEIRSTPFARSDLSVGAALKMFGWTAKTPIQNLIDYYENDFDYGFPSGQASIRHPGLETAEHYEDTDLTVYQQGQGGYSHLQKSMLEQEVPDWSSKVMFNTVVESIVHNSSEEVKVVTGQGVYTAKYVIVTFSIGVLQSSAVTFIPPLPKWKKEAIFGFQMANYKHFYLQFPFNSPWFVPNNTQWLAFASSRRGYYPLWLNMEVYLPGSRIIQCTVTNDEANRLERMTDTEIQKEAMDVLRIMFGSVPDPVNITVPKWMMDPFSHGSFCNWPPGYTNATHRSLAAAVGRIHFAGEAYKADYYAYLHGALLSGQETASKITQCLENAAICEQYIPEYLVTSHDSQLCETSGVLDSRTVWKYVCAILIGFMLILNLIRN